MNFYVIFAFLLVAVAATIAVPDQVAKDDSAKGQFEPHEMILEEDNKEKGLTCDVGECACAMKCCGMGKPSGYCNSGGTCVCYQK
ncbi:defensin-A-like isoform X2 [Ptiloglossa arizonensis]|uniref:defensin-A-like isoform X2 n=1 Tax=Ptiloglossa arizonensis TaxID=3350558 RepID=UPI003F9FE548